MGKGDTAGLNPEIEGMESYVIKINSISYSGWNCPVTLWTKIRVLQGGRVLGVFSPTAQRFTGSYFIKFPRTMRAKLPIGTQITLIVEYNFTVPVQTQRTYTKRDYSFPYDERKKPEVITEDVCVRGLDRRFELAITEFDSTSYCTCCNYHNVKPDNLPGYAESDTECGEGIERRSSQLPCPEGPRECILCGCGTCESYGAYSACPEPLIFDKEEKVWCEAEKRLIDCVLCKEPEPNDDDGGGSSGGGTGWDDWSGYPG